MVMNRHIAVGDHIDRQFVVAAEKKGRCNQLRRFDRFDVRTAPRCIGHFAVYFPLDDNHEPRVGRVALCDQIAVTILAQGVFTLVGENILYLCRRQSPEQRTLFQYRIHKPVY